jgi:hypothetical protein
MAASSINRKTLRVELASLLAARLQTVDTATFADGKLCAAVYAYLPGAFTLGMPVLCVADAPLGGSDRSVMKFRAVDWEGNDIYLNLSSFVPYATEAAAQDRLDDIEAKVADILMDNREHPPYWASIEYNRRTQTDVVKFEDGKVYFFELISLKLKVML